MNNAPERIWAWPSGPQITWYSGGCSDEPNLGLSDPEDAAQTRYIRADIHHQNAIDAMVSSGRVQYAYEAQLKAEAERDKLREVVRMFMVATSDETGFGTWPRMEGTDFYRDIDDARNAIKDINQ